MFSSHIHKSTDNVIQKAGKTGAGLLPRTASPDLSSPQGILQLQRSIGNRAVMQLLSMDPPTHSVYASGTGVVQCKSLLEVDMQKFAATLAGDDSHSTVAVAKDGDDYNIYSQSSLSSKSGKIGEYDNVTLKCDKSPGSGYHAEMMALMDGGAGTAIAASQPICKRCNAALTDNSVTAVNPGTQYTEHWQAPFSEAIDENKSFPAKAEDPSRDGQSGKRWGMASGKLYQIAKSKWDKVHTTW